MPIIEVYLTQSLVKDDLALKDKNVVVIDVLRATTTITVALANGAKEIIPSETVTNAARIARGSGNSLLCGERGGKIVEGFNLGNSPSEYKEEIIKNKSLIFSTTNGSVSIVKSKLAKSCVLGSFINISEIVKYIKSINEDFTIVCSGKLNDFCLEDAVCAGVIIYSLLSSEKEKNYYSISDSEYACLKLGKNLAYKSGELCYDKILDMHKNSEHGKYLVSLGFTNDLEICSKVDSYPILPIYSKGVIKLKDKMDIESSNKSKMKKIK